MGAQTMNPPRVMADRFAAAASACVLAGTGLCVLLWLLNALLDEYMVGDWLAIAGVVAVGLAYLIGPVLGGIACMQLVRHRHADSGGADPSVQHRVGRRFGRAAIVLALTGLVGVYVVHRDWEMIDPVIMAYALYVWSSVPPLLAVVLGVASLRRPAAGPARVLRRVCTAVAVILGLVAAIGPLGMTRGVYLIETIVYGTKSPTFSGDSSLLAQTVVVPTLDSPCPANRNVIWCSSFQLAWNEIRDTVVGAPVQVVGAEDLAARLNGAESSKADIDPASYYSAAGWVKAGIAARIREDMADKFPSQSVPDFADAGLDPGGILAYAFLSVGVPFKRPFHACRSGFSFTDSQGLETPVRAFGAWGLTSRDEEISEQVEILYYYPFPDINNPSDRLTEFAVDLCRYSEPYQVVAAVVKPKESLSRTLDYVQSQIGRFRAGSWYDETAGRLDGADTLVLPEMFWQVEHQVDELVGCTIANASPPVPIADARQVIRFRLDRSGAVLASYAVVYAIAIPRYLEFNRPFLLYIKKRDSARPFFVMWVDNAELLVRR